MTTTLDTRQGERAAVRRFDLGAAARWYRNLPLLAVVCLGSLIYIVLWSRNAYQTNPRGFEDLDAYRLGVQAWWHGQDMYGHLPLVDTRIELPFLYPPFAALVFSPLALLAWPAMVITMLVASLACLGVISYVCVRRAWPGGGIRGALLASAVLVPLSLSTEPVYDTLWFGQINLLLMLLVVLDCLVISPKWPRGSLIGIAAAIKLTPAVFLLYFLLRKDFRTSVTIVISGVAATAIGFVASWPGSLTYWFSSTGGARGISGTGFIGNQSLDGGLARLGFAQHEQSMLWLTLVVVCGALTVLGVLRAQRMGSDVLALSVIAAFGLLASPVSWGHYYIYEIPAVAAMVAVGLQRRRPGWLVAALGLGIVVWVPPFFYVDDGGYVRTLTQQLKASGFVVALLVLLVALAVPVLPAVARRLRAGRESALAGPDEALAVRDEVE
ncbi:MAG TPA: glycosyltransferase 87 family protein [Pseudonocardiaceae bacterium]|nr:glycosyltransferase 87 family protein [Pseudonocardiaceae bacterium]